MRIGTPALTTRGFGPDGLEAVGNAIVYVLDAPEDEAVRSRVSETVERLCDAYPIYEKWR